MENLKKVKETILELIYPSKCPFCGEIVSAGKKHSTEHNGICKACREKLPYIGEVRCMCCGKPLTDPAEEYCYDCTRQKHLFVDGRSLWVHKDAVENAVYAMKYQNRRIYGQTFGKEMAEHFLPYLWERKITLIVPVPLHSRRKRKRGFNQAEIVAKVLSENTGIAMDAGAVKRIKATSPQKELGDKGRKRNIRGAFAVQKNVKGEIMKKYDYLIVGAGLFGAVFAREATRAGKNCLVIDRRSHKGGNVYCEDVDGIHVHKYGAHIFHTDNKNVWDYVNALVPFNHFINSPLARFRDRLFNLPFNMNTFYQLWGVVTPAEAKEKIKEQCAAYSHIVTPANLEEQALKLCGKDVYECLIKGYTEKQWGRSAKELPAFIIRRVPFRFVYDNNYFNDRYQGIPEGGYNKLIDALLEGIEVRLNTDFFTERTHWEEVADRILFTGCIDEYFDYQCGHLEYRSLRFEEKILEVEDFQGNAVVNYTAREIPYTRVIEHKHFEYGKQLHTVITY